MYSSPSLRNITVGPPARFYVGGYANFLHKFTSDRVSQPDQDTLTSLVAIPEERNSFVHMLTVFRWMSFS